MPIFKGSGFQLRPHASQKQAHFLGDTSSVLFTGRSEFLETQIPSIEGMGKSKFFLISNWRRNLVYKMKSFSGWPSHIINPVDKNKLIKTNCLVMLL